MPIDDDPKTISTIYWLQKLEARASSFLFKYYIITEKVIKYF